MIITPHTIKEFRNDPLGFIKKMSLTGDTKIYGLVEEPIMADFPKDEGITFIVNKLVELENHTSKDVANALIPYIPFMKKHKIKIIKEYNEECSLALQGEIPNITVDRFQTQSFYGFNKFQIIDAKTLSRKDEKGKIFLDAIDFSYALDSNAASFFEKYCIDGNEKYKDLYDVIVADGNNIDITPYVFEMIMNGLKKYGINYKLNKNNKNRDQLAFFNNLSVLCNQGLFKEKRAKFYLNSIIKSSNPLIQELGAIGYQARMFLILLLEAKLQFGKSGNKIKEYVYSEMRKLNLPIENRLKAILNLFIEKPGHPFFEKVINMGRINNIEDYMDRVDNTARDIAIVGLEKYVFGHMGIYPILATDDRAFIKMLQDVKVDFIFKYDNIEAPIYINIAKEMKKKHSNYFETDEPQACRFSDNSLKELMTIYENKLESFKELINQ